MEQVMYGRSKSQVSGAKNVSKIGLNRVPVARLGLILGEDGATASRKLFRYLPGPKTHSKNQKYINNSRYTALAADMLLIFVLFAKWVRNRDLGLIFWDTTRISQGILKN